MPKPEPTEREPKPILRPVELVGKRTLSSKTFDISKLSGEGTRRLVATIHPMHYDNAGVLDEIDMTVVNGGVHKCGYDVDLYVDAVGYHGTAPDGKAISLKLDVPFVVPVSTSNKVLYEGVAKDTDLEIIFTPNSIHVNRVLKTPLAPKEAEYVVQREAGIVGKLLNLGADAEGKKTRLSVVETPTGKPDETRYTQTWSGEVAVMNPLTRKKEWKDDTFQVDDPRDSRLPKGELRRQVSAVRYPVTVDPTSTFVIDESADARRAVKYVTTSPTIYIANTPTCIQVVANVWPRQNVYSRGVVRFGDVTIPQGSTINTASLDLYAMSSWWPSPLIALVDKAETPPLLSTAGYGSLPWTASVWTADQQTPTVTAAGIPSSGSSGSNMSKTSFDVKTEVQSLVNSYDYSTDTMQFYLKTNEGTSSTESWATFFGWKYGASPSVGREPALVVNYTAPVTPIKTTFHGG